LDELIAFLKRVYSEMIPINSVGPDNGGPGELEKALYLESLLKQLGFKSVKRYDSSDPRAKGGVRPNLVAKLFDDGRPVIWIVAHIDTVPPGDESLWHYKPFEVTFVDGRVYGRGAEDDGQGVVLALCVAKALLDEEPKFDLGVAFVSDEETGSKHGAQHLLKLGVFNASDWVLIPDAGSADGSLVEVAEKSVLWFKVKVEGRQTHGSTPHKGVNANRKAMKLALLIDQFLHEKYKEEDALFEPPVSTFEPTKREPNVPNINTVPGVDQFYFDCRLLPRHAVDEVVLDVTRLLDEFSKKEGVRCTLEVVSREDTSKPTDPESPLVKRLTRALEKRGVKPRIGGIGGGTVAKYFRNLNIPCVVWMTCDDTAHAPDEYAKLDNVISDTRTLLELFRASD
jgi:acetylornithine deacetylase or succinyl-diaminopimelate desuccinylase